MRVRKKKKKERKHDLSCVCVCLGECVVFKIMDTLLTAVLRYSCWVYVRVLCIAYSDFDAILFVQLRAAVGAISCYSISRTYVCAFCKCVCEFWRCVSVVVWVYLNHLQPFWGTPARPIAGRHRERSAAPPWAVRGRAWPPCGEITLSNVVFKCKDNCLRVHAHLINKHTCTHTIARTHAYTNTHS